MYMVETVCTDGTETCYEKSGYSYQQFGGIVSIPERIRINPKFQHRNLILNLILNLSLNVKLMPKKHICYGLHQADCEQADERH